MTKRALAFTFIFAILPFAANAASKNTANIVLDSNVTVGTTELPKGPTRSYGLERIQMCR